MLSQEVECSDVGYLQLATYCSECVTVSMFESFVFDFAEVVMLFARLKVLKQFLIETMRAEGIKPIIGMEA